MIYPPLPRGPWPRRKQRRAAALKVERPKEINGRKGPEPTRYGDWESKGIASDF